MFNKRLFDGSTPAEIATYQEFSNISAEYHYLQNLRCPKCNQEVKGNRKGSRPNLEKRRMEDIWEVKCSACSWNINITMSVPFMEQLVSDLFGKK